MANLKVFKNQQNLPLTTLIRESRSAVIAR